MKKKILIVFFCMIIFLGVLEFSSCGHKHTPAKEKRENEKVATCTEEGFYDSVIYCKKCDTELSRQLVTVPKTHYPLIAVKENEKPVTCTEDGFYDSVSYCKYCKCVVTREKITVAATGHWPRSSAVVENKKDATCVESGYQDNVVYCCFCRCELSRETIETASPTKKHTVKNNACVVCHKEASANLAFTKEESYVVVSLGECKDLDIIIPDSYEGLPVTKVRGFGGGKFTSVTIPDSVTEIGYKAFYKSPVSVIGMSKNVVSIDEWAFSACYNLDSIDIPKSVTSIGEDAFAGCNALNDIYYWGDVAEWCAIKFENGTANPLGIERGTTYWDTEEKLYFNGELVTKLVIPDSVTSIGDFAFFSFESLTSVTFNNQLSTIGYKAFMMCRGLRRIVISSGVQTIKSYAFCDCWSLYDVLYRGTVAQWNAISKASSWDAHNYYDHYYGTGNKKLDYTITYNYTGE